MAVSLKLVLGTVNYTDYLRVSAAKVSAPSTEVFVQYIDVPVTNYTLVIPGLDPDDYYISFRDAANTSVLGTLVSQAFVNAQTGEWEYERRFYTIGALPSGATIDGPYTTITDPYLENKNVTGTFKEGERYLDPDTDYVFDDSAGTLQLVGRNFSDGEKFIVEIKYNVGSSSTTTVSGLFTATITVTAALYTISSSNKYKRFMLDCSGSKQAVTLPALSALAVGDFFYFEHKRDGIQAQTKILTAGTDKIFFNGFNFGSNLLSEIWVAKGKSLYLRKESTYWEVIFDYDGARVGERMAATFKDHPNWLPEDGRLLDGDEHPALYYWIRDVLPVTHYIIDDTVVTGGYTHPGNKQGQFVIHSTLKAFRLPNTQALSEKGLKNFTSYGADSERPIDYPGGWQDSQNKAHSHDVATTGNQTGVNPGRSLQRGSTNPDPYEPGVASLGHYIASEGGAAVWVQNFGVIFMRHI
jgi:hypothetical protein